YGHIAKQHEYVLFYAKNRQKTRTYTLKDAKKSFKYRDEIGPFNIHPLYNSNEAFHRGNRPRLYYPFYVNPHGQRGVFYEISLEKKEGWIEVYPPPSRKNQVPFVWRWGIPLASQNLNTEIVGYKVQRGKSKDTFRIVQKMRRSEKVIRSILSGETEPVTSRRGTEELESLLGDKLFSFPKPLGLLKKLFLASTKGGDIIVDFFAGSASTAEAVLQINAMKGEEARRYILVQLPEDLKRRKGRVGKSEELQIQKTIDFLHAVERPSTLDQIGMERILRAAQRIQDQSGESSDYGFLHYSLEKVQSPSSRILLETWRLQDGFGFEEPIVLEQTKGYLWYRCRDVAYLLEPEVSPEVLQALSDTTALRKIILRSSPKVASLGAEHLETFEARIEIRDSRSPHMQANVSEA
ncbi:MAG: DNA methyltransferase, partial [Myxococcota bacterium]|nr:DNA methyltransferase [Myxococcota bacterium]